VAGGGGQTVAAGGQGGPAGPVPAQLPRAPAGFVGRDGDLAALGGHAEPGALVILTGPPGVGKTALAVHWAQRAAPGFPDGQLHLNLRGYAPGRPLPPVEALAQLLRGLGTGPDRIPADADEAAALFRSTVAGRRVLVVLDNAADAAQVRPLLPGGAAAMTLVTSRSRLDGLVAHEGARRLTLRPLSTTDGVALLARLAGADRVSADAGAAAALADACAGLPLALRIAGTHLAADPTLTVAGYVAELRRGRVLAALALPEEEGPGVRSAFDLSYARLDGRARRQFRLLGVVPGPDITPDAAGALVGAPAGQARQLLDRLAAAHLADSAAQGRYHLHDLLRQYARELAADDRERDAARDRLFRWYLASSQAAARAITAWLPEPAADEGTVEPPRSFADATRARAWQEAERANLVAVALDAFDHRPRALGVRLAHSLNELFSRGWVGQWLSVAGAALAAARAEGEPADLAHAHIDLATAYHLAGRREDAARECEAALAVARHHGVRRAEAIAVGNLGIHRHEQGRIAEAAVHFEEFIRLSGTIGFSFGQATAHNNLGYLYHLMGRLDEARSHLAAALAHPVTAQRPPFRANTQACLAAVERDAGRLDDALAHGNAALASARAGRDRRSEAVALAALASVHSARSEFRHSVELGERALALARDGGLRETEAELLMGLSTAHRGLGDLDAALDVAGRGVELARDLGSGALEGQALTELAGTRLARGDVAAAARDAERARALLDGAGYGPARDRAAALLDRARTADAVP
jgi:tetratricopeptide (TPR) repeat protein